MTHNTDGHDRSLSLSQYLLKKYSPDLFLRQENWLFTFQHYKLDSINHEYTGAGIACDFNLPVSVSGLEKAKWGIDTLWKRTINHNIETMMDYSNERVQVLKLKFGETPFFVMNIYLPSTSLSETHFDKALSNIQSTLCVTSSQGPTIACGDWNVSLHRKKPTSRDNKFKRFCDSMGLIPAEGTNDLPTYHGHNNTESKLDYVLLHQDSFLSHNIPLSNVSMFLHICTETSPLIISTHDVLGFKITIPNNSEKNTIKEKTA